MPHGLQIWPAKTTPNHHKDCHVHIHPSLCTSHICGQLLTLCKVEVLCPNYQSIPSLAFYPTVTWFLILFLVCWFIDYCLVYFILFVDCLTIACFLFTIFYVDLDLNSRFINKASLLCTSIHPCCLTEYFTTKMDGMSNHWCHAVVAQGHLVGEQQP